MRFKILSVFLLAGGMLLSSGCSRPVATVNGKKIDKVTFDLHLKEKVQEHKLRNVTVDKEKLKETVLQELIGEKLMLDEAAARGIKVSDEEARKEIDAIRRNVGDDQFNKALKEKGVTLDSFTERTKEKMVMTKFIQSLVKEDAVTDEEMRDYYKNSQKPFMKPLRVHMKMMEFDSETEANAVAEDMKKNKIDFDDMAKKLSDKNKAAATDYGWVSPDFFSPSLASAIKNINPGQYGGPFKGQKSYYLVKVKERENESIATFDEVKENIRNILMNQKRQAALAQWLEQKKKTSKIEINLK